jgi:hypothetical protein
MEVARAPFFNWERLREEYPDMMLALENLVQQAESREGGGFELTTGASEILLVVLVETMLATRTMQPRDFESAVSDVIRESALHPNEDDKGTPGRSSRSILQAVASRWCKIPPICGRTR